MSRESLIAALGEEVRATQAVTDAFDEAVADHFGINRTDLRCIDVLLNELDGQATPGVLASRIGLTTGSVTAMIDRLAKLDYVTRSPDPSDRRKVVVRPTEKIAAKSAEIFGPLVAEGNAIVERYSDAELAVLADFQRRSRELQQAHLQRLRG